MIIGLRDILRKCISPSIRYKFSSAITWLGEQYSKTYIWSWRITRFTVGNAYSFEFVYIGRKSRQELARALFTTKKAAHNCEPTKSGGHLNKVYISEIPTPGAMCIPTLLSTIVSLDRPIEKIISSYHGQLRREIRECEAEYRLQRVSEGSEIEKLDREMIRPYAEARHGKGAAQLSLGEIRRMAQNYGKLDVLMKGDKPIGCQIGHPFVIDGKKYWSTTRCGYLPEIFSDDRLLRISNNSNIYLATKWAIENGYDFYDMGVALARPGGGLLEWKRRKGGELNSLGNMCNFYIRPPKVDVPQFFWDSPLFEIKQGKLILHLGLPEESTEDEIKIRYREMGFGGLYQVLLHCNNLPPSRHIEIIKNLYANQTKLPQVNFVLSSRF